jgi:hypothetical protein
MACLSKAAFRQGHETASFANRLLVSLLRRLARWANFFKIET